MAEKPISNLALGDVGLLNDADVTFEEVEFVRWDYNGNADETTALKIVMTTEDGTEHPQYWSVGSGDMLMPTKSGKSLHSPEGRRTIIAKNSNYGMFLKSLADAGITNEDLQGIGFDTDVSALVGTRAHVIRKPTGRADMPDDNRGRDKGGRGDRPQEILVVSEVHSLGKAKGKGKAKSTTKAKTRPADDDADEGDDAEKIVTDFIRAHLKAEDKPVDLDDLALAVMQGVDRAHRKEARGFLADRDWLESVQGISIVKDKVFLEE